MANSSQPDRQPKFRTEFFWTSIVATVVIAVLAFLAEWWSDEKQTVPLFFFAANAHAFRVFVYALLSSLLISILIYEVLKATSEYSAAYLKAASNYSTAYQQDNEATRAILNGLRNEITELAKGIIEGIYKLGPVIYRMLRYDQDRGIIFNALDRSEGFRNILFDSRTITSIFFRVKEYDQEIKGSNLSDRESILFELGKKAGVSFGRKIFHHIAIGEVGIGILDRHDLHQWLTYWCKFDTNAGFGRFEITSDRDAWRENPKIILRNSFLTDSPALELPFRLCEFMTGYIEGILDQIPGGLFGNYGLAKDRLHVEHPHRDCAFVTKDFDGGCTFLLTLADGDLGAGRRR
jgi:hypothetical protein